MSRSFCVSTCLQVSVIRVLHCFIAYSGDGVYLFSTLDEPSEKDVSSTFASTATPAEKRCKISENREESKVISGLYDRGRAVDEEDMALEEEGTDSEEQYDCGEDSTEDTLGEDEAAKMELIYYPKVPVILPRKRYFGSRNVDTTKDGMALATYCPIFLT